MQNAYNWASCSHSKRKKVGCVISHDNREVSPGYNGREQSQDNSCEDENGKTRSDVIHAELNAILFAARKGISTEGATMYITCAPCENCVPMIKSAGITKVIYHEHYKSESRGTDIDAVKSYGIELYQIDGEYVTSGPIY